MEYEMTKQPLTVLVNAYSKVSQKQAHIVWRWSHMVVDCGTAPEWTSFPFQATLTYPLHPCTD